VASARRDSRLIQGTVDLLILKALTRGPLHGYAVSAFIRERTNGELGLDDAALYQALHRLEHRRLIESEWGLSDNNRRAKFYEITRSGRRRLAKDSSAWQRYARAVFAVLDRT
jgi:transcriptional regulator